MLTTCTCHIIIIMYVHLYVCVYMYTYLGKFFLKFLGCYKAISIAVNLFEGLHEVGY